MICDCILAGYKWQHTVRCFEIDILAINILSINLPSSYHERYLYVARRLRKSVPCGFKHVTGQTLQKRRRDGERGSIHNFLLPC